ncbi:hypothetical protein ACQ4PT_017048 [Festuca glaucescens]
MVVGGADPSGAKPDGGVRLSLPRGGAPVERRREHTCARIRPWVRRPASAAYARRQEGGFGLDGTERDEAAVAAPAGGNAGGDLVRDGAERFSGPVTGAGAREAGGNGGGGGGFGWRRGLAPAAPPLPKRRAVSPTRRLPHVCGREPAAPVVRSGDMGFFRVRVAPSHGVFGSEEGVLLQDVLDKVVAAKGGAPAADWYPDGPNAMVGKASHDSVGSAGFLEINGAGWFSGARRDQLGKKHLESLAVQGQELEEGEIADTMGITQGMIKNDADAVIEPQELEEGEIADTMDNLEDMIKNVLNGPVEEHKLEEGATMDIVGVMANEDFDVPVERHKLGERRMAVQPPVKANDMPDLVTLDKPCSSTSAATIDLSSAPALASKEKCKFEYVFVTKDELKDKSVVYLDDDDTLMAVAIHQGKLQLCRSVRRQGTHGGGNNAVRRVRVRMMCRRFEFLCRFLDQAQGSINLLRVDLAAYQVIKNLPDFIKYRSMVGQVDGVEVGDEFVYRVELAIVGLHSPLQAGIDTTKDTDSEPIAVSIVASGGYLDEYCSSSGELTYIGSGGKAAGTDQDGDQKLEHANLALKNCIERSVPVRVTHGIRTEEGSHSVVKEFPKFIYDGLYHVVAFWPDGMPGSRVFKYKLRRDARQPQLPLSVTKWLLKSVVHHR